jgi:hypothetical protein
MIFLPKYLTTTNAAIRYDPLYATKMETVNILLPIRPLFIRAY